MNNTVNRASLGAKKNKNLIKRLLSYSHEKQSPQRFARYAAMLIMLLTLGFSNAWGDISYSGGYIYFDNSLGINDNTLQICARQSSWTGVSSLSNIENTKLYYVANPQGSGWGGILGWVVISADPAKSDSNFDNWSEQTWCSDWNTYGFNSGSTYLIVPSSTSKSQSVTTTYYSDGYSALNSTQTINTVVKTGSGSYTAANSKATISIASYAMTGDGEVTKQTTSISTSAKTQTVSAARTATTTFTVGDVATGYQFDGWYTAATGGTLLSASSTYIYYPTAATTVYARFSEKMSTVTLSASPSGKGSFTIGGVAATNTSAGVTTTKAVTAVPIDGYHFVSWSITGGATISSTTTNPTTVTGGGAGTSATLTATFAADDVYSLTVAAGTGISSVSGSTNDIKAGNNIAISATVATGYTWSTWTKTAGSGTLSTFTAGTKNQTVTVGTAGDITLTASATENMSTLTTSNSYDAGDPSYAAPSVAGSHTNVGYVTTRTITATAAGTGYTFAGWTITNGTRTDGGEATATTITVRSNGDGAAVSVVANYEEDLSSTWKILGGTNLTGDDWTEHAMTKKTGHSTESVAYYTFDISSTNSGISGTADVWSFKIKNGSTWYGLSAEGSYWWTSSTIANQGLSTSGANIQVCANVTGPYVVKVDYTTPASPTVTVTFPTSYTLTYDIGTVKGTAGSISTSPTTASGSKVLSGSTITLTAPDEKDGYSWKGWYGNAAGTGDQLEDDEEFEVTMDADKTLYACYEEIMRTVTVNVSGGGKVSYNGGSASTSCSASAGVSTLSATISAIPDEGYAFIGWTGVNADNDIPSFVNVGGVDGWNSTNEGFDIQVRADENTTITANFEARYALVGAKKDDASASAGMPGWGSEDATALTYSDGTYTIDRTLTLPNTNYAFKIIDRRAKSWKWYGLSSSDTWIDMNTATNLTSTSNNAHIYTLGSGSYTFTVTEQEVDEVTYPRVSISNPTSWQITMGAVTDNGQDGGSISAEDGDENTIVNENWVKNEGSVTFTAAAVTPGYRFIDFRTSDTYGEGDQLSEDNPYEIASVEAAQTIYAHFAENLCTVTITANDKTKGSITVGSEAFAWDGTVNVGVYNYKSLVVTPVDGYYFSGWTLSSTPDFRVEDAGESGASTNLRGLGGTHGSTGTLTANFQPLDTIYFKNTLSWAKVFVYFNPSWDAANDPAYSKGVYPIGAEYTEMTNIGDNIYRALIPRSFTRNNYTKVAFSDVDMHTYNECFYENNAVYRDDWDYNTKTLDMYIPCVNTNDGATHRGTNKLVFNGTTYYNHGYWVKKDVKINDGMGYYIKNSSSLDKQFTAIADDEHTGKVTVRVDNLSNQTYYICSAGGREYSNTGITFTSGGGDNQTLYIHNSRGYFTVTPSAEGDYTFYLYQDGDHMSINVSYPVSPGDYRIRHSYTDGETKYSYSDIIKKGTTSDKVSMYIRNTSGTLMIAKCSGLDANKKPVWTTGINVTEYTAANFPKAGVYVFDLALVDGNLADPTVELTSATISNVAPYTGEFYIKTDCAPGGWTAYKSNILDKNTVNFNESDASTFDYYYCQWAESGENVKCVIANDYNIQLTDTLKADAILLACSPDATNHQSIPQNTNIRFSYNSTTNELKRAYLTSVYGTDVSNVKIKPSTAEYVYQKDAATDLFSGANLKEAGNWTYQIDVDVYPGNASQTKIETVYPTSGTGSATRELVGNTVLLGSGSKGANKYRVRLVYDFKTNKLTSAFIPSATIGAPIDLNTDYLYARVGEESSTQLSFSGDGALNNVKKAYAAFEFPKDQMVGQMPDWTSNDYRARRYCRYYFSLPFAVRICDIFGVGEYGNQYIIQKYNGEKRAEIGWFQDTDTFWETLGDDDELEPNRGYALMLDREAFNDGSNGVWTNIQAGGSTFLYFPSKQNVSTISGSTGSYPITAHMHTSNRVNSKTGKAHSITDSNWAMIGANAYGNVYTQAGGRPAGRYEYNPATNGWTFNEGDGMDVYKSLHAYMVQWAGTFQWQTTTPASVAARQKDVVKNNTIQLNLIQNDEVSDKTFVKLNNEASTEFVLNEDVCKIINSGVPNIYTYAGVYDVALSQVPEENQIVSVGVVIRKNGKYTFSMPENINGTVTLIDEFEQTRTNLSLSDYEVTLPKGTNNDRFKLEINVKKIPTAIDGVEGEGTLKDGKAHKFLQNGVMYILQNGCLYDAQGRRVE